MKAAICLTFLICLSCLVLIARQLHRAPEGFEDEKGFHYGERIISISRDQALTLFHRRYPRELVYRVHITDTLPDNCGVPNRPADCWFVLFSDEKIITRLQSSRLVAVSKNTGEIIYDGDANDEG
jgi:hypothetical protein